MDKFLERRQRGCSPSTAERLHQQNAGVHPSSSNLNLIALVIEIFGLCRDDLEVVVPTADVTVGKDTQVILCRIDRLVLLLGLALEDSQRREVVFDLLKRGEGCLAIIGDGRIVLRTG